MDPERPIEKLLRETAKKRRDQAGAPFELHPATRRLFQGEVARLFKSPAPGERPGWRSFLVGWPRLAWGIAGLAVILVAATLVLLPSAHNKQPQHFLAQNEAPSAPSSPASAVATDSEKLKAETRMELADSSLADKQALAAKGSEELPARDFSKDLAKAITPAEPRPTFDLGASRSDLAVLTNRMAFGGLLAANGDAQPAPTSAESSSLLRSRQTTLALAEAPAVTPAPTPPLESDLKRRFAAPESEMGLKQANTPVTGGVDAYFTDLQRAKIFSPDQLAAPAAANANATSAPVSPAPSPVLVSFKVEQTGDEFRIVDRDGSVYTGFLQNAVGDSAVHGTPSVGGRTANRSLSSKTAGQLQAPVDSVAAGRYFFRVSGTNKSLNQKVVFSGNLLPIVGPGADGLATNVMSGPAGNVTGARAHPGQAWLLNSRVSGRALINDRQQLEINAVPGKP